MPSTCPLSSAITKKPVSRNLARSEPFFAKDFDNETDTPQGFVAVSLCCAVAKAQMTDPPMRPCHSQDFYPQPQDELIQKQPPFHYLSKSAVTRDEFLLGYPSTFLATEPQPFWRKGGGGQDLDDLKPGPIELKNALCYPIFPFGKPKTFKDACIFVQPCLYYQSHPLKPKITLKEAIISHEANPNWVYYGSGKTMFDGFPAGVNHEIKKRFFQGGHRFLAGFKSCILLQMEFGIETHDTYWPMLEAPKFDRSGNLIVEKITNVVGRISCSEDAIPRYLLFTYTVLHENLNKGELKRLLVSYEGKKQLRGLHLPNPPVESAIKDLIKLIAKLAFKCLDEQLALCMCKHLILSDYEAGWDAEHELFNHAHEAKMFPWTRFRGHGWEGCHLEAIYVVDGKFTLEEAGGATLVIRAGGFIVVGAKMFHRALYKKGLNTGAVTLSAIF